MVNSKIRNTRLIIIGAVVSLLILISDIFTPLGIADGVSYVAVVLLTLWMSKKQYTLIAAILGTVFTIGGVFISPEGEPHAVYFTNRALSLLGIWSAAFLILRFKDYEKTAARTRDNLNALFNFATVGIIITDKLGRIFMINPEAEKQFGYKSGELSGSMLKQLIKEDLFTDRNDHSTHDSPILREDEFTGQLKNGGTIPVEARISSYLQNGEEYYVVFVSNISERKKQEKELVQSHNEIQRYAETLKQKNAELENFAYISSHDLQEPLRKIQSFGDRLKMRQAENPDEVSVDYIDRMLNASSRMQRLIDDLLSFSRLTSRAMTFEKMNVGTVVREVMSDLEVAIEKAGAIIQMDSSLPDIYADPTQMRQLFQNLIANSIKFRRDGVAPVIKIKKKLLNNDKVEITIEDNGIGFDEKYAAKIFDIFQRLEGKKYEGSGIGLAVCKKIVNRHNGEISVSSEPGMGSKFIFTLPLSLEKATAAVAVTNVV